MTVVFVCEMSDAYAICEPSAGARHVRTLRERLRRSAVDRGDRRPSRPCCDMVSGNLLAAGRNDEHTDKKFSLDILEIERSTNFVNDVLNYG